MYLPLPLNTLNIIFCTKPDHLVFMEVISLQDYRIYIGKDWSPFEQLLTERQYAKVLVVVDENTEACCLPRLRAQLSAFPISIIRIPAGEQFKTINTCQDIWQQMMDHNADRKSLTINLGGGVIGDMGGFCASTFKRGMDFIQVPTTLLSQVDASIGGKLGIDFMDVKNSVGVFNNPQAVFIFPEFLKTLPFREIRSGFAEIIKHSLIADAGQWQRIQTLPSLREVNWPDLLVPSLEIKKRIVLEDPFEKSIRKALNFGHTIGHAIEGHALHSPRPLLHGEAIAIGMICEAYLSHRICNLGGDDLKRISHFILSVYDTYPLQESDFAAYLHLMTNDKKNENQQINFSLIESPGRVRINQTGSGELIRESLQYYNDCLKAERI